MENDSKDAYTEVGGTTPWTGEVELRLEQQPRATQDAKAEGGGRERLEHVLEHILESRVRNRDRESVWTTIGT